MKRYKELPFQIPLMKSPLDKIQLTPGQALSPGFPGPFIFADSLSSVETLLTNIQGLLKVALDNAHFQEKQIQQEKKELQTELYREREIRENLEKQLAVELQSRTTMQKRLKKEKKAKRKLQEALEFESKRREQVEQALKQATTGDSGLRMLKDTGIPDTEVENNGTPHNSTTMQGTVYMKVMELDVTKRSIWVLLCVHTYVVVSENLETLTHVDLRIIFYKTRIVRAHGSSDNACFCCG
ncbi:dachshund homolog 2-like [Mustela putorius furo]|uniref:Dachshund homolog 2-like n=1 Tax=Mustela putorius furo TaxID=9669 RepID=A0A8U0S844_MUSPF|nr:dachshund homolog 2-like [Mustela putorius furo]